MRLLITLLAIFYSVALLGQQPELTIQLGHSKLIYDVAYSPNGDYIASASADRTVKIWETEKGREVRTIYIDNGYATSVLFSGDSKKLLVGGGSYDIGELKIYDIETGKVLTNMIGHQEYAWDAAFSQDDQFVYSASFDGTLKKWNATTGKELASTPNAGSILRDLSIDPLNEYIVVTNDDDSLSVTLWSLSDLKFQYDLQLPMLFSARDVEFTADGQFIIVGDFGGEIAIFKRGQQKPMFVYRAHNDAISDIVSAHDGQSFFTCGHDKVIHQWEVASGLMMATFVGHEDRVYGIDIHPNGEKIISGGSFDKSVLEWRINDHSLIRKFAGNVYPIRSIQLLDDNNQLLCSAYDDYGGDAYVWNLSRMNKMYNLGDKNNAYRYIDTKNDNVLIADSYGSFNVYQNYNYNQNNQKVLNTMIYGMQFHPVNNSIIYNAKIASEDWYAPVVCSEYDLEDKTTVDFSGDLNVISGFHNLQFTKDQQYFFKGEITWSAIALGKYTMDDHQLVLEIRDSVYNANFKVSPDEKHAVITGGNTIKVYSFVNGELEFEIKHDYIGHVNDIVFINDNEFLIAGGDWSNGYLARIAIDKKKIVKDKSDFNTSQNALAFDERSKLIYVGGEDAKISVLSLDNFELQLTLLAFANADNDWAAIHPSGLFDGSPNAFEQYLYFTYNLEPIELFQLKERYYEPGLIQKVLGYNQEPLRDVKAFTDVRLYPKAQLNIQDNQLNITLLERNGGIGKVSFYINHKELLEDVSSTLVFRSENANRIAHPTIDLTKYSKFLIPGQENKIQIFTENQEGSLSSAAFNISYVAPKPSGFGQVIGTPQLHALVVGTADYRGEELDLNYAAKDAIDFAHALEIGGHNLFGQDKVAIHLLTTDAEEPELQPTKTNISKALKSIAADAGPDDVLVLYFSGHGVSYGNTSAQFHYLTMDVGSGNIADPMIRDNYTITTNDIINWIKAIPAQKQFLILDACSSGKAVQDIISKDKSINASQIKAFDKMKDRTGLFIIAGSASDKVSYEASQYGQSLLTYSLLNGLNILSNNDAERMIDLVDWINYSKEKVPELANTIGGIQEPVVALPRDLNSFDVLNIPSDQMISIASVKPIFIRSNFLELNEHEDLLGLSEQLDDYFQNISTKGKSANLIYVDVNKFPNAYSIKGIYNLDDKDQVTVSATLRKGEEKLGTIEVKGQKQEMDNVISELIGQINGLIGE
ncbi:MAG: caspase family protein [Chitinophagales bacterium]